MELDFKKILANFSGKFWMKLAVEKIKEMQMNILKNFFKLKRKFKNFWKKFIS